MRDRHSPDLARARTLTAVSVALALLCPMQVSNSRTASPAPPSFRAGEPGSFDFDTGTLRGKMRVDGKSQGISTLTWAPTGAELLKSVGLLSYYRVFSSGKRYGNAARDWPQRGELLPDGALRITFPPAAEHPLEIVATYRWRGPDTLDLETVVRPEIDMPRLEIFLSSYTADGFDGLVYVKPNRFDKKGAPAFLRADWHPFVDGNYLVFPRDLQALPMVYDGRWEIPPNPVTWAFGRYLEAPIGLRRDAASGITFAILSPPEDCFAVLMPYNRQPPDNVAGHSSVYLSLFGVDVAAGKSATAHCRLIVAKDLTDAAVLERYRAYLDGRAR